MTALIETAFGARDYLNAGQLLFALSGDPAVQRVRARFRRLATSPGFWSPALVPGLEGVSSVTLTGEAGATRLHFLSRPDLPLQRGGAEAPCSVEITTLEKGPLVPRWAEAEFEGAVWSATIRLARQLGAPPGTGRVWRPVAVEGRAELLDPRTRSGRIRLEHTRDRMGVRLLRVLIDGRELMELSIVAADLK